MPKGEKWDRAQVSFTLDAGLLDDLDQARWADQVTRSEWIRQAIQEKLDRRAKGGGKR